ncbi:MAG: response regulator transcription factor [Firmicutes bacterium]|nr:response regulator transcription factor [Bacillota bacterium]
MALIYIVEDDLNIREIETIALRNSGFDTEAFENAALFFEKINAAVPGLVLLDIMLPDSDGVDVLKKLRTDPNTKNIPVIMVTAKTSEIDKVKALDLGADDYITKPFGVMELISRVKAVLRRTTGDSEKVIMLKDIIMDEEKHTVSVKGTNCELTFKEFELLKALLLNTGIVLTRDIIMERVWGTDFIGESRTLDMHIKTLRQKLKESDAAIKTVRNVGYTIE